MHKGRREARRASVRAPCQGQHAQVAAAQHGVAKELAPGGDTPHGHTPIHTHVFMLMHPRFHTRTLPYTAVGSPLGPRAAASPVGGRALLQPARGCLPARC
jgi:hypothetical protein